MLGKIVNDGVQTIIYSKVQKTSSSGLFCNQRLALLSLPESTLGYLSKVPDSLTVFQDGNFMSRCKEMVKIKQVTNFKYKIDSKNASVLKMSWLFGTQQKQWEFKFDNQQIADQWMKYIALSLEPPKPPQNKQQNIDFSKIQSPKSRFSDYYIPKQKIESKASDAQQVNQFSYSRKKAQAIVQQASPTVQQQNNQNQQDGSTGRFYKFEQKNLVLQREDTLPIITTFKQKFTNHGVLNHLSNNNHQDSNQSSNWNLRWYQDIEMQHNDISIRTHQLFVAFCSQKCQELVKQITREKRMRQFIPQKINNLQEIYCIKEIIFKLSVPFSSNEDLSFLSHNQALLKQYEQELQSYRYFLRVTNNKGHIKVPLTCIIHYLGFIIFCQAKPPFNYHQVQDQALYLFQKPIQKLEQKLNINLSDKKARLYTNMHQTPTQKPSKSNHIIVYSLKKLLPKIKMTQNIYYYVPFSYNLSVKDSIKPQQIDKMLKNIQDLSRKFLNAGQSIKCRIISVDDLEMSLNNFLLDKSLIPWLITKCQSKYLYAVLASEIIAEKFALLVWITISENIKKQHVQNKSIRHFQDQIFKLMSQLIIPQGSSWQIVTQWVFKQYQLTIRPQNIIIGYLFSSVSKNLGIQLDYQVLINQKQQYFSSRFMLPRSAFLSFSAKALKYNNEDICYSYNSIQRMLLEQVPSEHHFKQVVVFYALQSQKPGLYGYQWSALCRFMSFFVPIHQDQGFEHLDIYQSLSLRYLNFLVLQTVVSAIKWLLLNCKKKQALDLIYYFNEISPFWIGQINPFSIILLRLVGYYYNQQRNSQKAIQYFTRAVQNTEKIYQGDRRQFQNLDTDYKLASLYLISGKHKQALQKFKKVKKVIQKQNKQSLIILDLLVEIAKLYLHLGAIQKCLYYAKQAIKFATLFPFKSQEQELLVYDLTLRALQILGDTQKMKFYISLVQEKFAQTSNIYILRQVLKLTITQVVYSATPYCLKKFAFFLHLVQGKMQQNEEFKTENEKFKDLKNEIGRGKCTQQLKKYIQNCPEIVDILFMLQTSNRIRQSPKREEYLKQGKRLKFFCDFVGFQYILGQIVSKLGQNEIF